MTSSTNPDVVVPFLVTPEICDHPPILPIKATTLLTETLRLTETVN